MEHMNTFLKNLEKTKRIMFVRRYFHFDSIEKIAKDFNISKSSVSVSLFRIRKSLKDYLEKEGVELEG